MNKTYKLKDRILSMITAAVMVFTMLPQGALTAHAEGECTHEADNFRYEYGDSYHNVFCEDCGEFVGSITHMFEDGVCTECFYPEHEHIADENGWCRFPVGDGVCGLCAHTPVRYSSDGVSGKHIWICACGLPSEEENCTPGRDGNCVFCGSCMHTGEKSYENSGNMGHSVWCLTCGSLISYEDHTLEDGKCTACGYCRHINAEYRWEDEDSHNMTCPDCDGDGSISHYIGEDDTCSECGYILHEHIPGADGNCTYLIGDKVCGLCAHVNTETEYDVEGHYPVCAACFLRLGDKEPHDFENGNKCRGCEYERECTHSNAEYRWENERAHYMACPDCGDAGSITHYFGEDDTCEECGYILHEHIPGADGNCSYLIGDKVCGLCAHVNTETEYDISGHFQVCKDCFIMLGDKEPHNFENGNKCRGCEYERECTHSNAEYRWEDEYGHYMTCPDCDGDGSISHNCNEDGTCRYCGYILHEHIPGEDGNCTYPIGDKVCGLCAHAGGLSYKKYTDEMHYAYCEICDLWLYDEEHSLNEYGYCEKCEECLHKNTEYFVSSDSLHNVFCTYCGSFLAEENHVNNRDGVCELCGYFAHEHTYTDYRSLDVFYHARQCEIRPCYEEEINSHDYSGAACPDCGRESPAGVFVAGNLMKDGYYVDCNGTAGKTKPSGGYAFYKNGRLTLNNFDFTGDGYVEEDEVSPVIYTRQNLEIVLEGENTLTCTTDDVITSVYGDITFSGSGSLALTIEDDYDGIDLTDGNLVINSGNITIKSGDNGIELDTETSENDAAVTINGGVLNIEAGDDGIDADDNVTVTGGKINICAEDNAIDGNEDVTVTGGEIYLTAEDYFGIYSPGDVSISGGYMEIDAGDSGIYTERINITGGNILIHSNYYALAGFSGMTISGKAEVVAPENARIEYPEGYDCYFLVDENGDIACNAEIISHRHSWKFTAEGTTIILTCKNPEGDCFNTDGGSLTLVPPADTVYTGQPVEADLEGSITAADVNSILFAYSPEDKLTDSVPVNAGTYKITLGVGDKEVSLEYTITPANPVYTAPAANTLVYDRSLQQLAAPATAENGTVYYSLDGENWQTDVPQGKDAGTYTVWYRIDTDENYLDVAPQSINVEIGKAPVTVGGVDIADKVYDGTTKATAESAVLNNVFAGDDVRAVVTAEYEVPHALAHSRVKATVTGIEGEDADNYRLEGQTVFRCQASVSEAPVTVKPYAASKVYGESEPVFEYEITEGRLYGTDTLAGALSREEGDDAGEYEFTPGTLGNPNYTITLDTTNKFTITKAKPALDQVTATIAPDETATDKILFAGASVEGTYTATAPDALVWGDNTVEYTFTPADTGNLTAATGTVTVTVTDTAAPEGEVTVEGNSWKEFINDITFGILFNRTVDVKAAASDRLSGVKSVEYIESSEGLTLARVKAASGWKAMPGGRTSVTAEDAKQFVYYIRITDNAGNVAYISTDGAVFDTQPPAITGISDGATYCTTQVFTVTDAHPDYVEINGVRTAEFVLHGDREETYTVLAADKTGNKTEVTVTMTTIDKIDNGIENLTEDTVTADSKADVEAVKDIMDGINEDGITDQEKELVNNIREFIDGLLKVIEETEKEVSDFEDKAEELDPDTVTSEDRADVEQLVAEMEEKLEDTNLTDSQKDRIRQTVAQAKEILDKIAEDREILEDALGSVPEVDTENLTDTDIASLEAAREKLDSILADANYTEEEKAAVQAEIDKIKAVAEEIAKDYVITRGADSSWTEGSSSTLGFTSNGLFRFFREVRIDGNTAVRDTDYTAHSGSTVITLKNSCLDTLSPGLHRLEVVYDILGEEYIADCEFTVKARPSPGTDNQLPGGGVPQTGDNTASFCPLAVMTGTAAALAVLLKKKKEYENS